MQLRWSASRGSGVDPGRALSGARWRRVVARLRGHRGRGRRRRPAGRHALHVHADRRQRRRERGRRDRVGDPGRHAARPAPGAKLSKPPLLRWKAIKGARYYNVQLFRRGKHKLLSSWPTKAHLQLRSSWTYRGHRHRLVAGRYRWYVWPGYGPRSRRHYGKLLGRALRRCPESRCAPQCAAMRCLYVDLDGTLLGAGGALLRDGDGAFSLLPARALEACWRAGVEVVVVTGRRRDGLREVIRLLGVESYVFEIGGGLVLDGEVQWLGGEGEFHAHRRERRPRAAARALRPRAPRPL